MPTREKFSNKQDPKTRSGTSVASALRLGALAGVALIALAAFLVYFPALSGGFIVDDPALLTENRLISNADGLYRFWCTTEAPDYWPVSNTTLWIEWRLWGMNSTGYHVTNLILHIIAALLIWIILRKLSIPGAFLAAMIFALHPVNAESVAWISQRKDMLAMLFFLLSILWYLKLEIPSPLAPSPWPLFYWLSLAAFLLAMLSKGSVVVLPVLLLGIVWWLRGTVPIFVPTKMGLSPLISRRDLVRTAPFFMFAVALAGVNVWFQTHGSGEVVRAAGFIERLLGAGYVVWFYLYKAILPVDLSFVYPQWRIEAGNPLCWLPLLAALIVTAVLWLYRKSWGRPLLFAWGFFGVALAPVMGFVDVGFMQYSLVSDHYQHIAIIGVIALAAAGCAIWLKRARGRSHRAATVLVLAAVVVCAFLTWRQSAIYRDSVTLFQDTLKKNPECWMAHNNLGKALFDMRRLPDAIDHFQQALRLKSDYFEAHYNLGTAFVQTDRRPEAIEQFEQALRLKPKYAEAHNNLGAALADEGRLPEAVEHYRQVLRLKPDSPEVQVNLGVALVKTGRPQEAIEHYEQALRLRPNYAEAHNNLGNALLNAGRLPEAIEHYAQALNIKSDSAETYYNLAYAYAKMRQSSEAVAAAQKAVEVARSQGRTALAKQFEDWLNSYRAGVSK